MSQVELPLVALGRLAADIDEEKARVSLHKLGSIQKNVLHQIVYLYDAEESILLERIESTRQLESEECLALHLLTSEGVSWSPFRWGLRRTCFTRAPRSRVSAALDGLELRGLIVSQRGAGRTPRKIRLTPLGYRAYVLSKKRNK